MIRGNIISRKIKMNLCPRVDKCALVINGLKRKFARRFVCLKSDVFILDRIK